MISGDAPNGATGATGSYDGGTAGGSANALTATVSGLGSSPSTGNVVILKTSAANTGAATLAINSGSAIAIKNQDGTTALAGGEMASAKYYLLEYNGTNWVLLNPVVSAGDIPVRRRLETVLTGSHPLTSATWTRLKTDVASVNTLPLTVSGTGNVTFTATEDIVLAFRIGIYAETWGNCWIGAYINGSLYTRSAAGQFSVGHTWSEVVRLASGQTLEFYAYASTGGNTDASYPETVKIQIFEIGRG